MARASERAESAIDAKRLVASFGKVDLTRVLARMGASILEANLLRDYLTLTRPAHVTIGVTPMGHLLEFYMVPKSSGGLMMLTITPRPVVYSVTDDVKLMTLNMLADPYTGQPEGRLDKDVVIVEVTSEAADDGFLNAISMRAKVEGAEPAKVPT